MQRRGRHDDDSGGGGGGGEDDMAGFGTSPAAYASVVCLQPEDPLWAGLGLLPLRSTPVRRTQNLTCSLEHVVCVARRLRGGEEGERLGDAGPAERV